MSEGGGFNKGYLELVLKQVKAERDAERQGERHGAWRQNSWTFGLRNTARKVRGVVDEKSKVWLGGQSSPQAWDVMEVDCGSAFCVAGHAALMAGDTFVKPSGVLALDGSADFCQTTEGDIQAVSVRAQELFGIDDWEAALLFDANNKWSNVKYHAEAICSARGERLSLE